MQLERSEIIDLLKFHIEADCADVLGDMPVNHFAEAGPASPEHATPETKGPAAHAGRQEGAAPLTPPVTPAVVTAQVNSAAPQNSAAGDSATLAKTATTLDELAFALESFEGCSLKKPQNPLYFPTA